MTVIAARIYDGVIRFASDRQTTAGMCKRTDRCIHLGKIAHVNGMTIGGCGYKSHSMWMMNYARNHAPLEDTEIDVSNFMLEFLDWMRKRDGNFSSDNEYLIAFRSSLFRVCNAMSVFRVPEFAAIGSGADFAVAAMHLEKSPKEAAGVAALLDLYCGGEIDELEHKYATA